MKSTEIAAVASIPVGDYAVLQSGTRIVTGVIRAGDLVERYEIPGHDYRTKTGYQRPVSSTRVNRLAADLRAARVDLPTAVLFNLRGYRDGEHLVEKDDRLQLRLNGMPLYVVDGQHRTEALKRLMKENPTKWEDFRIPFVCMLGADEREEMKQFHVVNSTAKSVRTDLALWLLKKRAESDPDYLESLVERGDSWKVGAQNLVEKMDDVPIWKGRIRHPAAPKESTTISSAGVVSSLKRPLGTPFFSQITESGQLKVLEAYWEGIREALPEPFQKPSDYVLQKTIGVITMHSLLETILEIIKGQGKSVIEKESYSEIFIDLLNGLQGENADGEFVDGSAFWLSGGKGAAGTFSSNAGRRVLIAKLKKALPAISVY